MKRLNASYFVFKYSDKYRFKRTFQDFVWFEYLRYLIVTIYILTMIANEMGSKRIKQQTKRNSCERIRIISFKVYLMKGGLQNYGNINGILFHKLQFSHFIPTETYLDVSYWFIGWRELVHIFITKWFPSTHELGRQWKEQNKRKNFFSVMASLCQLVLWDLLVLEPHHRLMYIICFVLISCAAFSTWFVDFETKL